MITYIFIKYILLVGDKNLNNDKLDKSGGTMTGNLQLDMGTNLVFKSSGRTMTISQQLLAESCELTIPAEDGTLVVRKNDLDAAVSIAHYTSNKYEVPADGYILLGGGSTVGSGPVVRLYGSTNTSNNIRIFNITPAAGLGSNLVFFVRKGMKVLIEQIIGTGVVVQYIALK